MCVLADGVMLGFLTYCGILDWKTREIPMWLLTLYSGVSVGLTFLLREERLGSIIVGFGVGVIFLLISKMTKEAVGYGDSWIITILGVYLGGQRLIWTLFLSSFFAGLVALFLLWKNKWKGGSSLPFVPFLAASFLVVVLA